MLRKVGSSICTRHGTLTKASLQCGPPTAAMLQARSEASFACCSAVYAEYAGGACKASTVSSSLPAHSQEFLKD